MKEQLNTALLEKSTLKDALEAEISSLKSNRNETSQSLQDITNQLRHASAKCNDLEAEVKTLTECNNDLNDTTSALEATKRHLEKNLKEKSESLRSAQKCIRKLESAASRSQPLESNEDLKNFKKKITSLNEQITLLTDERKEKISMLENLSKDFERETLEKSDLSAKCFLLETQLKDLSKELEKRTESLAIGDSKDSESLVPVVSVVLNNVLNQLDSQNVPKTEITNSLVSSDTQTVDIPLAADLSNDIDNFRALNEKLTLENEELRQINADFDSKIFELTEKQSATQSEYDNLQSTYKQLQEETSVKSPSVSDSSTQCIVNQIHDDDDVEQLRRSILKETLTQLKESSEDFNGDEAGNQELGVKKLVER